MGGQGTYSRPRTRASPQGLKHKPSAQPLLPSDYFKTDGASSRARPHSAHSGPSGSAAE